MTYLNVDVLFARILNKEGKGILPHRAVGPIAGLQEREETILQTSIMRITHKEKVQVL